MFPKESLENLDEIMEEYDLGLYELVEEEGEEPRLEFYTQGLSITFIPKYLRNRTLVGENWSFGYALEEIVGDEECCDVHTLSEHFSLLDAIIAMVVRVKEREIINAIRTKNLHLAFD
jgi:hypothetical protein